MTIRIVFFCVMCFGYVHGANEADTQEHRSQKRAPKESVENALQKLGTATETQAPNIAAITGNSDVMLIDPKIVSSDWVAAFNMLNAKKARPVFLLKDQTTIQDVDTVSALPGGYLMIFTIRNLNGYTYRIVKTSDISSLVTH